MAMEYNAKQGAGLALPVGEFDAVIRSAKEATSKSSGNPMLKLRISVGVDYSDFDVYLPVTPTFMPEIKAFFDAVGGYNTNRDFRIEPDRLEDKHVRIVTREDGEFNGRKRVRVERWVVVDAVAEAEDAMPTLPNDKPKANLQDNPF